MVAGEIKGKRTITPKSHGSKGKANRTKACKVVGRLIISIRFELGVLTTPIQFN